VTLVLSVHGRDTLWLVADRRLWYGRHRQPKDTAVKVMILETTDGVGALGYAGLGATPRGTQPSDWMSAVLRGRGGLAFEQALGVLSDVANRELPRLLPQVGGAHFIIIPAFVRGIGPRLYSIDNVVNPKTQEHRYRFTSHQPTAERRWPSGRLALGGTGGIYLASIGRSYRPLRGLLKAHDRGKISDYVIADELARLNYEAYQGVRDDTVGPRCIVVWRRRRDARPGPAGGGAFFYTRTDRDNTAAVIPTIVNGMDVNAIVGVMMPVFRARVASRGVYGGSRRGRGEPVVSRTPRRAGREAPMMQQTDCHS
jgi:hypothetical protein